MSLSQVTEPAVSPAARDRLLAGLESSIRDRGYRDTKISDIVAHARTSRRTFYEVFQTKEECFLALMYELNQRLQTRIASSVDPNASWDEQIRAGVTAWIEGMGSHPELTLSWIRELPSLGPEAARGQQAAMRALTKMLEAMTSTPQMRSAGLGPVPRDRLLILVGGLRELSAMALEQGQPMASITDAAVSAAMALLGPSAGSPPSEPHNSPARVSRRDTRRDVRREVRRGRR
jgi:AcrR family transcriptional regulator